MSETINAIIKSTSITTEGYGFLTALLQLDYGDINQQFGGYTLYLPESFIHHTRQSMAGHFIYRVMEIAEVDNWNKLPGKTIRVKLNGVNGEIIDAVGHIIKDIWFNPREELGELNMQYPIDFLIESKAADFMEMESSLL